MTGMVADKSPQELGQEALELQKRGELVEAFVNFLETAAEDGSADARGGGAAALEAPPAAHPTLPPAAWVDAPDQ